MSHGKFNTMLDMQVAMNDKTVPGWRNKGLPWRDAIWTECAELLDHIGWKWWKKQETNLDQARMELVDIWHFGMSMDMDHYPDRDKLASWYESRAYYFSESKPWSKEQLIREIVIGATRDNHFDVPSFFSLAGQLGMTLDSLHALYIGKNVLNDFRQNHGYKDGVYIKHWRGYEDNEVLTHLLSVMDKDSPYFAGNLYKELGVKYAAVFQSAIDNREIGTREQMEADKRFGQPHYGH